MQTRRTLLPILAMLLLGAAAVAEDGRPDRRRRALPERVTVKRDIEFAKVGDHSLRLDLYRPATAEEKPRLLVWIHGGGWRRGSRAEVNPVFVRLVKEGYATASIDYRLEGIGSHPKQIHDVKGAIRWLRAHAEKYGYDATRIGVGGSSAGGHLALLLGVSGGVKALEGEVGGNPEQSSKVQAVVDFYGPADLDLFARESPRFARAVDRAQLLSASPAEHLTKDDPPLLIFHGDSDKTVPVTQSERIHLLYENLGLASILNVIEGAAHGGRQFTDKTREKQTKEFLGRHIKKRAAD